MKRILTRRGFIKSVAITTVIAPTVIAVAHPLLPARDKLVQAAAQSVIPSVFVRGIVIARSATRLTLQTGDHITKVRLPEGVSVFRNGFVTVAHIRQGDEAAIAGVPTIQGTVEARRLWINLPEHILGSRW